MTDEPEYLERPDGGAVMAIGWTLLVLGIVALLVAFSSDSPSTFITAFAIGQLGIVIGAVMVPLGYVVRAIWFLPGREIPKPQILSSSIGAGQKCEWCGVSVAMPMQPCATIEAERLVELLPQIKSEKCRAHLAEQGIIDPGMAHG